MKTDLYTKALLTLITLFLGVLSFDKVYDAAIPEAKANEPEAKTNEPEAKANEAKWDCMETISIADIQFPVEAIANKKGWSFMTTPVKVPHLMNEKTTWYVCGRP